MIDWLSLANNRLSEIDQQLLTGDFNSQNFFIIGAPRAGTTLLNQFIAACCEVGYVDNLMASFWRAPSFGAFLSNKLIKNKKLSSNSTYGQTALISDPHEFGKFWRDSLGYTNMVQREKHMVDWCPLIKNLNNIAEVYERPMLYKVFQLYWHIEEFQKLKSNTKWVWIERDFQENIKSLLMFREKMTGSKSNWVSAKPLLSNQFTEFSDEIQVASQVIGINEWISKQFQKIEQDKWLKIQYEDLIEDPYRAISIISEFLDVELRASDAVEFIKNINPLACFKKDKVIQRAIDTIHASNG